MEPFRSLPFLLLYVFAIASADSSSPSLLRMRSAPAAGLFCDSWMLSVETNNAGYWRTIPPQCLEIVADYVNGDRYLSDSDIIAVDSLSFAETVRIVGDGKDAWVFDIDETLLSNLPYYAVHGFGSEAFNETSFDEWVDLARAPALPASLRLYDQLLGLGFQIVLLTGRGEIQRNATEKNLLLAGYHSWERIILRCVLFLNLQIGIPNVLGLTYNYLASQYRQTSDFGKPAVLYKSERRAALEAEGFRIRGNSGDQWSDLLGTPMVDRSFKLPNPMYCIK